MCILACYPKLETFAAERDAAKDPGRMGWINNTRTLKKLNRISILVFLDSHTGRPLPVGDCNACFTFFLGMPIVRCNPVLLYSRHSSRLFSKRTAILPVVPSQMHVLFELDHIWDQIVAIEKKILSAPPGPGSYEIFMRQKDQIWKRSDIFHQ